MSVFSFVGVGYVLAVLLLTTVMEPKGMVSADQSSEVPCTVENFTSTLHFANVSQSKIAAISYFEKENRTLLLYQTNYSSYGTYNAPAMEWREYTADGGLRPVFIDSASIGPGWQTGVVLPNGTDASNPATKLEFWSATPPPIDDVVTVDGLIYVSHGSYINVYRFTPPNSTTGGENGGDSSSSSGDDDSSSPSDEHNSNSGDESTPSPGSGSGASAPDAGNSSQASSSNAGNSTTPGTKTISMTRTRTITHARRRTKTRTLLSPPASTADGAASVYAEDDDAPSRKWGSISLVATIGSVTRRGWEDGTASNATLYGPIRFAPVITNATTSTQRNSRVFFTETRGACVRYIENASHVFTLDLGQCTSSSSSARISAISQIAPDEYAVSQARKRYTGGTEYTLFTFKVVENQVLDSLPALGPGASSASTDSTGDELGSTTPVPTRKEVATLKHVERRDVTGTYGLYDRFRRTTAGSARYVALGLADDESKPWTFRPYVLVFGPGGLTSTPTLITSSSSWPLNDRNYSSLVVDGFFAPQRVYWPPSWTWVRPGPFTFLDVDGKVGMVGGCAGLNDTYPLYGNSSSSSNHTFGGSGDTVGQGKGRVEGGSSKDSVVKSVPFLIGVIVGAVVLIGLLALLVVYCSRKGKKNQHLNRSSGSEPSTTTQFQARGTEPGDVELEDSTCPSRKNKNQKHLGSTTEHYKNLVLDGQWKKLKLLGRGANGSVYSCLLVDGSTIALKEMPLQAQEAETEVVKVQQEMAVMRQATHPYVVQYYAALYDAVDMRLMLFTELVSGGSLGDLVRSMDQPLPEVMVRRYVRQIVEGLAFLHSRGIIHRDLKADNILRTSSGTMKIADFGASRFLEYGSTIRALSTVIGTPVFMAPEVLNNGMDMNGDSDEDTDTPQEGATSESSVGEGSDEANRSRRQSSSEASSPNSSSSSSGKAPTVGGYGRKADIWSLGIMVCELADRGRVPWPDFPNPGFAFIHIAQGNNKPIVPPHVSPLCASFIEACCERNPKARPSAKELLEHPFLAADLASGSTTVLPSNSGRFSHSTTGKSIGASSTVESQKGGDVTESSAAAQSTASSVRPSGSLTFQDSQSSNFSPVLLKTMDHSTKSATANEPFAN